VDQVYDNRLMGPCDSLNGTHSSNDQGPGFNIAKGYHSF
jgi:hypothetical protein